MKQINLTITALSPLAIGTKKPGSVSEAGEYIPGTVIRGAIASQIIRQSGLSKDSDFSTDGGDFKTLFLDDNSAIFHNAYPAKNLLPATAVSSKAKPGFYKEEDGEIKANGVFDSLIDRFLAEQYNHPYDPNCPLDNGRVEPFSGFYSRENNTYRSYSVNKRLLTRVGINRKRNVSQDEILYSLEVIDEAQGKEKLPVIYYSSILIESDDLAESLKGFIEVNKNNFRFGGSKSRGLGKVEIKAGLETITLEEKKAEVRSQIKQFNEKLNERKSLWSIFGDAEANDSKKQYFTINLQANAILNENWLRTTVITEEMLPSISDIESNKLKLETAYSSYGYVSGWNNAWGLMKDIELITNKGGLYLFSINNLDGCIEALTKLELFGIGEKTNEGFGRVKICDPFHLKSRESLLENN
ncbi:MAG: CRISPR-associated RAMP protein Csx10 [Cyanobacteria bacterium P01_A01_bin.84]